MVEKYTFKEFIKQIILICILLSVITITGCENYRYEIEDMVIDAKILGTTNECIGIQYEIGGITVLEDICDLKVSQLSYITGNAKDNTVKLTLHLKGTDLNHSNGMVYFYYYLGGEKIGEGNGEMDYMDFAKEVSNHPNFVWKVYNGVEGNEPPESDEKESEKLVELEDSDSEDKVALPTLKVK